MCLRHPLVRIQSVRPNWRSCWHTAAQANPPPPPPETSARASVRVLRPLSRQRPRPCRLRARRRRTLRVAAAAAETGIRRGARGGAPDPALRPFPPERSPSPPLPPPPPPFFPLYHPSSPPLPLLSFFFIEIPFWAEARVPHRTGGGRRGGGSLGSHGRRLGSLIVGVPPSRAPSPAVGLAFCEHILSSASAVTDTAGRWLVLAARIPRALHAAPAHRLSRGGGEAPAHHALHGRGGR